MIFRKHNLIPTILYCISHLLLPYLSITPPPLPLSLFPSLSSTYADTVEAPVGVGFSYSDKPDEDYNTDDNKTALDNYRFLVEFFKHFPEYKDHDFYIA